MVAAAGQAWSRRACSKPRLSPSSDSTTGTHNRVTTARAWGCTSTAHFDVHHHHFICLCSGYSAGRAACKTHSSDASHRISVSKRVTSAAHHRLLCHHAPTLAGQMTDRRTSAAAAASPRIPPAPPPPPPKQKQRSYFERFVAQPLTTAYGSRPPSVQTHRPEGGPPNPLVPKLPGYVASHCVPSRLSALFTFTFNSSHWLSSSRNMCVCGICV